MNVQEGHAPRFHQQWPPDATNLERSTESRHAGSWRAWPRVRRLQPANHVVAIAVGAPTPEAGRHEPLYGANDRGQHRPRGRPLGRGRWRRWSLATDRRSAHAQLERLPSPPTCVRRLARAASWRRSSRRAARRLLARLRAPPFVAAPFWPTDPVAPRDAPRQADRDRLLPARHLLAGAAAFSVPWLRLVSP
jgi:hypothetical protein